VAKKNEPKNPHAVEMAKARARKLTAKRRSEIARKAAEARWRKEKNQPAANAED
jgi:hypothetical protein